jgi:hypothetical protein
MKSLTLGLMFMMILGSKSAGVSTRPSGERVAAAANCTQEVYDEKSKRTPAQKKIDSQLFYALKQKRGETRGIPPEHITFDADEKGRVLVDITAIVGPVVTSKIRKLGGAVISEDEHYHTIRAWLALEKLEALAGLKDVRFIAPPAQSLNNRSVPD